MPHQDWIGKRGEAIATQCLMRSCGADGALFDVYPLGAKCPTFDLFVQLFHVESAAPFFLAQVKSTRGYVSRRKRLKVNVEADDVLRMVQCPVPTYLIGIDEPREAAYLSSVHGIHGAISSLPARYPLNPKNLRKLWQEVRLHWEKLDLSTRRSVFLFEDIRDG